MAALPWRFPCTGKLCGSAQRCSESQETPSLPVRAAGPHTHTATWPRAAASTTSGAPEAHGLSSFVARKVDNASLESRNHPKCSSNIENGKPYTQSPIDGKDARGWARARGAQAAEASPAAHVHAWHASQPKHHASGLRDSPDGFGVHCCPSTRSIEVFL